MATNKSSYKIYDDLSLMLSVPDVAKVLGISRAGAYDLAHSRDFPSMKMATGLSFRRINFFSGLKSNAGRADAQGN